MDQPNNDNDLQNNDQNLPENNINQDIPRENVGDAAPYQEEGQSEVVNDVTEGVPSGDASAEPSPSSTPLEPTTGYIPEPTPEPAPESTSVEMPESMPEPTATEVTPEQQAQAVQEAEQHVAEADPQAASSELADVASELQAMESQNFDNEAPAQSETFQGTDPMEQIQQDEAAEAVQPVEPAPFTPPAEEPAAEPTPEPLETPAIEPAPVVEETAPTTPSEFAVPAQPPVSESIAAEQPNIPETQPTGQVISDVIAPSSTAAAAAAGTAGINAITGTPETTTTEVASAGIQPGPTKPKSKKGLLVLIVILVTLLFGGAAVAAYLTSTSKPEDNSQSANTQQTQLADEEVETLPTASPGQEVEAATLDDYKAACGGGKVLNAAAYGGDKVHPIVMFEKGSDGNFAQNILAFKDKTWTPDMTSITTPELVGCIAMKEESAAKLKACPITDPATKVTVNVDYYSTTYAVTVYEALTGKQRGTFDVATTSTECPTTATYNKADPKIFAKYEITGLEAPLTQYVAKGANTAAL